MTSVKRSLVTLLGRSASGAYNRATYQLPDRAEPFQTHYIGAGLARALEVDEVVLLGTAGSMWDAILMELDAKDWPPEMEQLSHHVQQQTVDQELLERVSPALCQALDVPRVLPLLLPMDSGDKELAVVVRLIAQSVHGSEIHIDVTHGFRHLAMAGMLASHLFTLAQRKVSPSMWYGAWELKDKHSGITPVIRLQALNLLQAWINALAAFDATGHYAVFEELLLQEGVAQELAARLVDAQHLETLGRLSAAVHQLRIFLKRLPDQFSLTGTLFIEPFKSRLNWSSKRELHEQQMALAHLFLHRGDHLKASMLAYEAVLTRRCVSEGWNPDDHFHREAARKAIFDEAVFVSSQDRNTSAFVLVNQIRNQLVHGTPAASARAREAVRSAKSLQKALATALNELGSQDCIPYPPMPISYDDPVEHLGYDSTPGSEGEGSPSGDIPVGGQPQTDH